MNIALYSHNGNLEGAPVMLTLLAQELQKRGHLCHMILNTPGVLETTLQKTSVHYSITLHHFADPSTLFELNVPDMVIVNTVLGFRIVEAAKKAHIPVLWIIHESNMDFLKDNDIHAAYFRSADAVIFPSTFTRNLYSAFDTGNFHVIPNGVPIDSIRTFTETHTKEALRAQYNIPSDATVFLSVGTHQKLKGHDRFIEAGVELMKAYPEKNIHCVVAGSIPSPMHQTIADGLLQTAWKHNQRNRVHVYADFPLIYDLYALSDFYVCASDMETFPMTVLEAMAFRLPIVACNVGGIPEQITTENEGILVEPHSATSLRDGMHALLHDTAQSDAIRNAAEKRVSGALNTTLMCDRYVDTIESLASPTSPRDVRHTDAPTASIAHVIHITEPRNAHDVVRAAIAQFPYYTECIVVVPEDLPADTLSLLQDIPHAHIAHNEEPSRAFDMCRSTWIVYTKTDGLWILAPSLNDVPDTVGCMYGRNIIINGAAASPEPGSLWIIRSAAWRDISPDMHKKPFCSETVLRTLRHTQWKTCFYDTPTGIAL